MIYYFSGTGNSKYSAEKLAVKTGDRAVSMVEALKNGADNIEAGEKTGFVFPVYFWGLPEIVRRFAESVKGRLGGYVYCVITCGADTGGAAGLLAKALGREPDYSASLRMPDNYVIMYDPCPKDKALKFLRHSDAELDGICADIIAGKKRSEKSFMRSAKTAVLNIFYNPFRKTKYFFADDKCVSCGKCAQICPDGAIEIKNGKPEWIKPKCQHCTACINRCPQKAIQFGKKTAERGRYNILEILEK